MITFAQLLIASVTCKVTAILFAPKSLCHRPIRLSKDSSTHHLFSIHLQTFLLASPISLALKPLRYICVVLMSA